MSDTSTLLENVVDLLHRIEYATVATVSEDARPWNTPVYFARKRESFYWTSRRDAQHSINIRQSGRAFVVVFDSSREDSSGAGVYVDVEVSELANEDDIEDALELIYRRRDKPVPPAAQFSGGSIHAVYHAHAVRVWTNLLHTSSEIPWDERIEIKLPGDVA